MQACEPQYFDRCPRRILILCWQHFFLTLAGVEPMDFAISIDELPSRAICWIRRRMFGVNMRIGRMVIGLGHPDQPTFAAELPGPQRAQARCATGRKLGI